MAYDLSQQVPGWQRFLILLAFPFILLLYVLVVLFSGILDLVIKIIKAVKGQKK